MELAENLLYNLFGQLVIHREAAESILEDIKPSIEAFQRSKNGSKCCTVSLWLGPSRKPPEISFTMHGRQLKARRNVRRGRRENQGHNATQSHCKTDKLGVGGYLTIKPTLKFKLKSNLCIIWVIAESLSWAEQLYYALQANVEVYLGLKGYVRQQKQQSILI